MSKWEIFKIGDVCDVIAGQSPKGEFYNSEGLGLPFYQGKKEFGKKFISSPQTWTTSVTKVAIAGDILMSIRAPVGPVNFATQKICIGRGLAAIRARESIDKNFLFYYLFSNQDNIKGNEGAVFASINKSQIQNISLPVPPIEEQKRIVEILDKAFEGIAQAEANTRQNLANAHEVFNSCLDNIFIKRGDNWIESILSQVCQFENGDRGKNYPNREEYVESGIPWINTGHIQPDGTLSQSEMNFISREKYETLRGGKIQPGDLVYCLRGATIGKTALVDPLNIGAIASSLVILRPNKSLDSKFLYYFLISSPAKKQIKLYDNGAAQPNLGAKSVAKYIIYFPDFSEQKNIVKKLDHLAEETKRLKAIYQRKLEEIAELKQSILEKAFTGQLSQ
jgi:type I restriction enzyme S subunit